MRFCFCFLYKRPFTFKVSFWHIFVLKSGKTSDDMASHTVVSGTFWDIKESVQDLTYKVRRIHSVKIVHPDLPMMDLEEKAEEWPFRMGGGGGGGPAGVLEEEDADETEEEEGGGCGLTTRL